MIQKIRAYVRWLISKNTDAMFIYVMEYFGGFVIGGGLVLIGIVSEIVDGNQFRHWRSENYAYILLGSPIVLYNAFRLLSSWAWRRIRINLKNTSASEQPDSAGTMSHDEACPGVGVAPEEDATKGKDQPH